MSRTRRRRRARRVLVGIALVAVISAIAWLGLSWWSTYRQVRELQAQVSTARADVDARNWSALTVAVPGLQELADQVSRNTQDPAWRVLESMPFIGPSASAVAGLAQTSAMLVSAAEPLLPYAERIVSRQVRRPDGSLDLQGLIDTAPLLQTFAAQLAIASARLEGIDQTHVVEQVAGPLTQLREQLSTAVPAAQAASQIATYLPAMLGMDGPRRWVVVLQNPAEARGTGGFPGGYAVVEADGGRIRVIEAGKGGELNRVQIPLDGIPEDSRVMWGSYIAYWSTFNMSPHFPLMGQLVASSMAAAGTPIDGVVAIDPRTVAAFLSVTGPVTAAGETITAETAESYFTVDSYARHPDMDSRAAISLALVKAVFDAVLASSWDPAVLADAMTRPIEQGRVRVWSADPGEQEWLQGTAVGGSVPDTPGPVVAVSFNDAAGSKMDAFVQTGVDYRPGICPSVAVQNSSMSIAVMNQAPLDLPLASGNYGITGEPNAPEGSTRLLVYIYAPVNANFTSATIDGHTAPLYAGVERDRPVWWTYLTLNRGQQSVIDVSFTEPTVQDVAPRVLPQGMVLDERVTVRPSATC